jgi:hypothetical protein
MMSSTNGEELIEVHRSTAERTRGVMTNGGAVQPSHRIDRMLRRAVPDDTQGGEPP